MNKKRYLELKLFVICGLVLFLLLPTAFAIDQEVIGKIKTFEELETAIDQAKEMVQASPKDVEAHHLLARLLVKNGKFRAAEKALNTTLKIDREHLPSLITFILVHNYVR